MKRCTLSGSQLARSNLSGPAPGVLCLQVAGVKVIGARAHRAGRRAQDAEREAQGRGRALDTNEREAQVIRRDIGVDTVGAAVA